ncbi:hypothetical protein LC607_14505 [Nostoc sp. CHAB 5824]|nr:hypothetical protein [Nostoc sp. CHAB 5824]
MAVSLEKLQYAVKLRVRYLLSFYNSLIIASAVLGQASILSSEDMQNGLIIENALQIMNPFLEGIAKA